MKSSKSRNVEESRREGLSIAILGIAAFLFAAPGASAQTPVDRFLAAIETDSALPAEAKALIRKTWSNCQDCDASEFLIQGLAVFSERFRAGLDAYDADDNEQCALIMAELVLDQNPFVAAHARAYEIKALVALGRTAEADQRIEAVWTKGDRPDNLLGEYTYMLPEIAFLRGFCKIAELQYSAGAMALRSFLEDYPTAPQRLLVSAKQMLRELENRDSGGIGEVVDLMHFSGRRLTNGESGDLVQQKQQRILDLLDQLIEDAKKQEQSSGGGGGGGGQQSGGSQGQQQGGPSAGNPMQDSMLPSGAGSDGDPERTARRANPGEQWGNMPPAQRERILQALRESFPSRYRRLVEQYYEELAKKP